MINRISKYLGLTFIIAIALILLSGCATTQYILTGQYYNPNTEQTEQIDVPVSQHEYDSTNVGESYTLKIHTAVLGIRIPMTKYTNSSGVGMMDVAPMFLMAIPVYFLVSTLFSKEKRGKWKYIIVGFVFVGFSFLIASTTTPDFDTIATKVDKTSGIY